MDQEQPQQQQPREHRRVSVMRHRMLWLRSEVQAGRKHRECWIRWLVPPITATSVIPAARICSSWRWPIARYRLGNPGRL